MHSLDTLARRTRRRFDPQVGADVFVPGDRGYDQARQAWNLADVER